MGSRIRYCVVVAAAMAATFTPMQEQLSAQSGAGVVISEFRFAGPKGTNDEFIELFNAGQAPVTLNGWTIRSANNLNAGGGVSNTFLRATIPASGASVVIQPGCYYLIANAAANGYTGVGTAAPDLTYATGIADDGGVALVRSNGTIADQVGFVNTGSGFGFSAYFEGTKIGVTLPLPAQDRSYERKPSDAFVYQDNNDNATDFALITPSRPQNKTATCASLFKYPHEIQGNGAVSPLAAGTTVNVKGVVTGVTADGFFMQTETVNEDADVNTSEGLFVSSASVVTVGRLVGVTGKVAEFKPATDPASPTRTQLDAVSSVADLGAGTVPPPVALTSMELSDAGTLAQLERFEGMRVTAATLSAVSGSDLDGAFSAVLLGQPRPFREPGVHASDPVLPCALAPCDVPVFDGNPELLRVDADGLSGVAAALVSTGALLNNVTGPLDFTARAYTLLPESALAPGGGMSVVAAAAPSDDQFTIASLNLGVAYPARLAKASLAVRNVLNQPDVVGVQGVDTVGDLLALAAQVNADAAGSVHYDPYPSTGNAADPLGVGFLVRADRVSSPEATPLAGAPFDHAPVVLTATVRGASTRLPQDVTVIVSEFASEADIARADAVGSAARARRQAQADFLAGHIQGLQIGDPNGAIVALGNYNAVDFNDGYVDVVGTVRGVPAPENQVVLASPAVVSPALFNPQSLNAWSEQYSSLSNGSAQSLDHVLINANLSARLVGLVHARINADFPHALASDASTPVRLSDRDPLVVYFTFPPDLDAPVFSPVSDVTAEATGPDGALVTFATPVAHDNLDETVNVTCNPSSGTQFALGNSGVTCSAHDAAGNPSSVSFTVTVQDTTAPGLVMPANVTAEATSASGRVVTFTASATDAVTAAPAVTCDPPSGSSFPVGTTHVNCTASDGAGNTSTGSFSVTITEPEPSEPPASGRMSGDGDVGKGNRRVTFAFDVRESAGVDRGWIMLTVHDAAGRPDRLTSSRINDVRFVSSNGGSVDTVLVTGAGHWNGRSGYRFEIAAADHGEPGRGCDTFTVRVMAPNGAVVASASDTLRNGNVQLDQTFLKAYLRQMAKKLKRR